MLWAGSRAMGLHPWHPEALALNPIQLHAAAILANPSARENRAAWRQKALGDAAMKLALWMDDHVTSRRTR